jgi:hypothetical protein
VTELPAAPLWAEVKITPTEFRLHTGEWAVTTQLTIHNAGDKMLYSVWVDLSSDAEGAIAAAKWNTDRDPNSIKQQIRGVSIDADVMALLGTREDGKVYVMVRFYQLAPHSRRVLTITGTKQVKSVGYAAIISALAEPEPILSR